MSFTVMKAGFCDTIQDKGRHGYGRYGINISGAMDLLAMQAANALAGNDLDAAVVEMHFPASAYLFNQAVVMAISGADFNAMLQLADGSAVALPVNKTVFIPAGTVLSFKEKIKGERCYLAVAGGLLLTPWLNSCSTNLKIKQGGFRGRALKKDDTIELRNKNPYQLRPLRIFPWMANFYSWYFDEKHLNVMPGPEWDWLDDDSKKQFGRTGFVIGKQSDRMGISLEGITLQQASAEQLVSSGVTYGTIQLLPNGQLIILAADHPATGGYPRIATIIAAHLPKLAQAAPGTTLRFITTTADNATELLLLQQKEVKQMQMAVRLQWQNLQ